MYLALGIGRCANYWSSLTPWGGSFIVQTFGRQAIPMVWDYAEGNPLSTSTGNWRGALDWIQKVIRHALPASIPSTAVQKDAQTQRKSHSTIVSTDPPYYDNIAYADLSDFFYVWLRRSMRSVFPELFATLAVPKAEELVATPYRHGSKEAAEMFFLNGMTQALRRLAEQSHPGFPVSIFYAFKQSETKGGSGTTSTGWETFLDAVIRSGFAITGTWPMRTERDQGLKTGSNVLASSIVLVCRRCISNAPLATRREFLTALRSELPQALRLLQTGNIAPVDLAQAAIGPGMAVYTRYAPFRFRPSNIRMILQARIVRIAEFYSQQTHLAVPTQSQKDEFWGHIKRKLGPIHAPCPPLAPVNSISCEPSPPPAPVRGYHPNAHRIVRDRFPVPREAFRAPRYARIRRPLNSKLLNVNRRAIVTH